MGKTHLLIGAAMTQRREERPGCVARLTTDRFFRDLTRAIHQKELARFQECLQSSAALILDDVERLAGMARTQQELLSVLDAHLENGRPILMAGACHPRRMKGLDPRLLDRMASGLVIELPPPDPSLRRLLARSFLESAAALPPGSLEEEVVHLLAERGPESIRGLQGFCRQILFEARMDGKALDTDFCRSFCDDHPKL